ncbi:hypothetical protein E8E13_002205 [Curvularia kusanoi]|uniref:YitH/HolE acetyltransferase (GNAT) domain-containing protein n=1 Tax=Curvularia kusanoi TaxID=90978 RepID=A0A9P4T4J0_CURKU|nr:hypothetical protein E8E13_002205 [Curvularia kusanoi]
MPPPSPPHTIHPSRSLSETTSLWYPLIHTLGWNRSLADGPMHYHAALDGSTWLLVSLQAPNPDTYPLGTSDPQYKADTKTASSPQGCILALPYPNGTGWIGFFLMNEAQRGRGMGGTLWRGMDAVWEREGVTTIGLDGVEEQVPTYTRRGFVDVGRIPLMMCSAARVAKFSAGGSVGEEKAVPEGRFVDARKVDREVIRRLDERLTGLDRQRYWVTSDLWDREGVFGFAYFSPSSSSELSGFVLVRACDEGHRIGPLFAPDPAVAIHLLKIVMQHPSITASWSSGSLIAEAFGANAMAKDVFEELGWEYAGVEYHRMWYQGRVPEPQQEGGLGTKCMFAVFDAACG